MPALTPLVFTPDMLSRESVRGFVVGPEPWEREITDWLQSPPGGGGAADDLDDPFTAPLILLYLSESDDLVGVGAVGPSLLSWPKPSSERMPASCITMLGVDHRHRKKGYGQQILDDLIAHTLAATPHQRISLSVRVGNPATDFYARNGFRPHGKPRKEAEGHENQRMVLDLSNRTCGTS